MIFDIILGTIASLLVAISIAYLFYESEIKDNKCRYHKQCKYYVDNFVCNNDDEANGYCGIFKEFRKFESECKK